MDSYADIAFDCLPLRSVGRVDVPLDASTAFRQRCEHLQQELETQAGKNAYFLYNAHCVFRLANSDVHNMLRFTFEGTVWTDHSDRTSAGANLRIELAAETCGGVSADALDWFRGIVERAVLIEFDRFIAAGQLEKRATETGRAQQRVTDLTGFAGLNV